jgi:HAD superfamily hydrolase (TIGR01509 family)
VVTRLHSSGFPLALASSSPRRLIEAAIDALGLASSFGVLVSSDEVARGKPAPDVYRAAVERLASTASDTAAVEDSPSGMRSALAAGLALVALPAQAARHAVPAEAYVASDITELTPELMRTLRR